jgi:hypothetical protein
VGVGSERFAYSKDSRRPRPAPKIVAGERITGAEIIRARTLESHGADAFGLMCIHYDQSEPEEREPEREQIPRPAD